MQEGKAGKRQDVYRLTLQDGVVIKKELIRSEVLEEPQAEITEIGTKYVSSITVEENIQIEEIDFEKQTVENHKLAKGIQVLLQKGKPGKRQYIYRVTLQDGVVIKKELIRSEVLEEPQVEITEIGTLVEQPRQERSAPADSIIPTVPSPKQEELKPLAVPAQEPQTDEAPVVQDNFLPETGQQSNWWLSLIGILMMFLTFIGLKNKKDDF